LTILSFIVLYSVPLLALMVVMVAVMVVWG
jgi:hypothetical protein